MLERSQLPAMSDPHSSDRGLLDVDRLFSILRRQLRVLLLCLGLGLMLAVIYLMLAPKSYVATSQILLDKNLKDSVSDIAPQTSAVDLESEVLNQIEVMRSSRIATAVAQAENLMTDREFLNPPPSFSGRVKGMLLGLLSPILGSPEADPDDLQATPEEAAGALRANMFVERVGRSAVIRVGYEASSPELAQRIAAAYANVFVQDQLNADIDATKQAADWLQQRLTELGDNQRQATLAVEEYRQQSGLSTSEDENLSNQRLQALTAQLVTAQAESARVNALAVQLQATIDAGPSAAGASIALLSGSGVDDKTISDLRIRYASIQSRINEVSATYGEDHPQVTALKAENQALQAQIFAQLQGLNEQYQSQLTIAQRQEASLRDAIETEGQLASQTNQAQVKLTELQQRSTTLGVIYNSFLSRYEEAVQRQSFPIPSARIITVAQAPESASGPRTLFVAAGGVIFGLFLGLMFGTFNELRERTFRIGDQVGNELGLRFLGYLPRLGPDAHKGSRGDQTKAALALHGMIKKQVEERRANRPTTAFVETLKSAKLVMRARGKPDRSAVIGVVSVLPGEGKTTYSVALAEMLATDGERVLLIDADLRQAASSRLVAPGATSGLMDIGGTISWRDVVLADPRSGLHILPALSSSGQSSDFLSSDGMQNLLEEARQSYDYVVIDLPPLGPVMDARAVLPWTDGFILVTEWGRTPRRLVRSLIEHEPELAEDIVGVVLNKVDFRKLAQYSDPGGAERYMGSYSRYYQVDATEKV